MNDTLALLKENQKDFLNFLKGRYSLYHLSNVFFRDLHYGVMAYLNLKNVPHRYLEAESVTKQLVDALTSQEILRKIDSRSFMLNYPDFKKPPVKPAAPPKPAAKPAAPAKQGQQSGSGESGKTAKPAEAKKPEEAEAKAEKETEKKGDEKEREEKK